MKLTSAQLSNQLTKKLASIYLISGEEIFLKQEAIELIRHHAKQAGFQERIRFIPETNEDWEQLHATLNSPSLFAAKQFIELDCRQHLPNKMADHILQQYGQMPSANHVLLIDLSKLEAKTAKSAWFQMLEKNGVHVPIWPIPPTQLPQWLIQRAKKHQLTLTAEAATMLAAYTEGNSLAAAQMIEKLYLLAPEKPIDNDLLQILLADESRFNLFELVDQLLNGKTVQALRILDNLRHEGVEPILILWGITRELRTTVNLIETVQSGAPLTQAFQLYKVFPQRQAIIRQFIAKVDIAQCLGLIKQALELDKILKGAVIGDSWRELTLYCLRLISLNSH